MTAKNKAEFASALASLLVGSWLLVCPTAVARGEDFAPVLQKTADREAQRSAFLASAEVGFLERLGEVKLAWRHYPRSGSKALLLHVIGTANSCEALWETHKVLHEQGNAVFCYDHRGQGRSTRLGYGQEMVHVDSFDDYVSDLDAVVDTLVLPRAKAKALSLLSSSMGGAVSFLYLQNRFSKFCSHFAVAPMVGLNTGRAPRWLAAFLADLGCLVGRCKRYFPGQGDWRSQPFGVHSGTSDPMRWEEEQKYWKSHSEFRHGGKSHGWLKSAFQATSKLESFETLAPLPTRVAQAGLDSVVLPEPQARLCAKNPKCRLELFAQARHGILNESDTVRRNLHESMRSYFASCSPHPE
ncbi:MAG: alpha/beta fold hydrolase [Silvanigrellales bacterium]|nr:alpha/beta fold hydrolase [Silvanigrellales bacterium]